MIHPVTNRPADKRSFIPSKWEKLKVFFHSLACLIFFLKDAYSCICDFIWFFPLSSRKYFIRCGGVFALYNYV